MQGHLVNQLDRWNLWAQVNPAKCPCRGSGWLLSDYDTYHRCGLHAEGASHPEDDGAPYDPGRKVRLLRKAFSTFRKSSGLGNLEFHQACLKMVGGHPVTPQEWVDAAELVSDAILNERREAQARAQGYSCDLERQWDEEAVREQLEWRVG